MEKEMKRTPLYMTLMLGLLNGCFMKPQEESRVLASLEPITYECQDAIGDERRQQCEAELGDAEHCSAINLDEEAFQLCDGELKAISDFYQLERLSVFTGFDDAMNEIRILVDGMNEDIRKGKPTSEILRYKNRIDGKLEIIDDAFQLFYGDQLSQGQILLDSQCLDSGEFQGRHTEEIYRLCHAVRLSRKLKDMGNSRSIVGLSNAQRLRYRELGAASDVYKDMAASLSAKISLYHRRLRDFRWQNSTNNLPIKQIGHTSYLAMVLEPHKIGDFIGRHVDYFNTSIHKYQSYTTQYFQSLVSIEDTQQQIASLEQQNSEVLGEIAISDNRAQIIEDEIDHIHSSIDAIRLENSRAQERILPTFDAIMGRNYPDMMEVASGILGEESGNILLPDIMGTQIVLKKYQGSDLENQPTIGLFIEDIGTGTYLANGVYRIQDAVVQATASFLNDKCKSSEKVVDRFKYHTEKCEDKEATDNAKEFMNHTRELLSKNWMNFRGKLTRGLDGYTLSSNHSRGSSTSRSRSSGDNSRGSGTSRGSGYGHEQAYHSPFAKYPELPVGMMVAEVGCAKENGYRFNSYGTVTPESEEDRYAMFIRQIKEGVYPTIAPRSYDLPYFPVGRRGAFTVPKIANCNDSAVRFVINDGYSHLDTIMGGCDWVDQSVSPWSCQTESTRVQVRFSVRYDSEALFSNTIENLHDYGLLHPRFSNLPGFKNQTPEIIQGNANQELDLIAFSSDPHAAVHNHVGTLLKRAGVPEAMISNLGPLIDNFVTVKLNQKQLLDLSLRLESLKLQGQNQVTTTSILQSKIDFIQHARISGQETLDLRLAWQGLVKTLAYRETKNMRRHLLKIRDWANTYFESAEYHGIQQAADRAEFQQDISQAIDQLNRLEARDNSQKLAEIHIDLASIHTGLSDRITEMSQEIQEASDLRFAISGDKLRACIFRDYDVVEADGMIKVIFDTRDQEKLIEHCAASLPSGNDAPPKVFGIGIKLNIDPGVGLELPVDPEIRLHKTPFSTWNNQSRYVDYEGFFLEGGDNNGAPGDRFIRIASEDEVISKCRPNDVWRYTDTACVGLFLDRSFQSPNLPFLVNNYNSYLGNVWTLDFAGPETQRSPHGIRYDGLESVELVVYYYNSVELN